MVDFEKLSSINFEEEKQPKTPAQDIHKPKSLSKIFIMKRGLFREFSAFYKNEFSKFVVKWNNLRWGYLEKCDKMEKFVLEYIKQSHLEYFNQIDQQQKLEFILCLKEVLFSNRYKKSDSFLQGWNFKIIRKLLYSFSVSLRNQFLKSSHNKYLMQIFLKNRKQAVFDKLSKRNPELESSLEDELHTIEAILSGK